MNIAVLGVRAGCGALEAECARAGFALTFLEDLKDIRAIGGKAGEFVVRSGRGRIGAAYILLAGEAASSAPAGAQARNPGAGDEGVVTASNAGALALDDTEALDALPYGEPPVAFVLDHPADSPARDVRAALEWAARLAARRHRVVFLAKHVRTAGGDLEALYRQARRLGVVFHKYEAIEIGGAAGAFRIRLTDRDGGMAMDARAAVFAQSPVGGELERIAKLLRLRADGRGVGGGRFHLFPARTSRKGVYFLNSAACSGEDELLAQARCILSEIRRDLWAAEPGVRAAEPGVRAADPGVRAADPGVRAAEPGVRAADPGVRAADPGVRAAEPGVRARLTNPDGYAQVDAEKCAFCYTCYRICPHAAMAPDHEASAMKNVRESCAGCGICASACPASAIAMEGRAGDGAQAGEKLRIFCCENSGSPALGQIRARLEADGARVSATPVRCGGELGAEAVLSALAEADRVLVAVCVDDACRHFEGNRRAKRQVDRAKEMLRASGLDEGRVMFLQLSHAMPAALEESVREMDRAAGRG